MGTCVKLFTTLKAAPSILNVIIPFKITKNRQFNITKIGFPFANISLAINYFKYSNT